MQSQPFATTSPTLAVVNARVWTGDERRPWADALAVSGERLVAVGSSAEVRKLAGAGARVIDAGGQLLLPGIPGADGDAGSALLAFMASCAHPGSAEQEKRILARGMPADFVMVDRDITRATPEELHEARIMLTVAAGRVVFERAAGGETLDGREGRQ